MSSSSRRNVLDILTFVVFFLDDGVIAGTDDAVAWFCVKLQDELSRIGLSLNSEKCIASPSSGAHSQADRTFLENGSGIHRRT